MRSVVCVGVAGRDFDLRMSVTTAVRAVHPGKANHLRKQPNLRAPDCSAHNATGARNEYGVVVADPRIRAAILVPRLAAAS